MEDDITNLQKNVSEIEQLDLENYSDKELEKIIE